MINERPGNTLVAVLVDRVDELIAECRAGLSALEETLPTLKDLRGRIEHVPPMRDEAVGYEPEPTELHGSQSLRIQVIDGSVEQLLNFQEHLAQLPEVEGISILGLREGGASLLVTVGGVSAAGPGLRHDTVDADAAGPTVVCTVCGSVIALGGQLVSHGLCPGCTTAFMRGEVAR